MKLYVVIHQDNPITTITKEELEKIYLGKQQRWPNLLPIERFDYPPVQQAFYEQVLGIQMVEVTRYWNQQKIMGGYRRPLMVKEVKELLPRLRKEAGGVAYVTTKNVPKYLKVVAEFDIVE